MTINNKNYSDLTRELAALRAPSDTAFLDAQLLLMHVVGKTRAGIMADPSAHLTSLQKKQLDELMEPFQCAVPMAYILEKQEFWSIALFVSPAVLIPRPETECLVDYLLSFFKGSSQKRVLDMGTGSGAIALALKSERPDFSVTASDFSFEALVVARKNAESLNLAVTFEQGNWLEPFENKKFDCIVSNPPYISSQDEHLPALKYEPISALTAGRSGFDAFIVILEKVCDHLELGGLLVLEHGYDQQPELCRLLESAGFEDIEPRADLSGLPRFVSARKYQ